MPRKFVSLRDLHLTSTAGHTIQLKAGVPKNVPEALVKEALAAGCVEYTPERAAALADAARSAAAAIDGLQNGGAPVDDPGDPVREAVLQLLAEGDLTKLTKEGAPKVHAVRQLVPEGTEVSSLQVYDLYLQVTDNGENAPTPPDDAPVDPAAGADLADPDGITEPVGDGVAGLTGDEPAEE